MTTGMTSEMASLRACSSTFRLLRLILAGCNHDSATHRDGYGTSDRTANCSKATTHLHSGNGEHLEAELEVEALEGGAIVRGGEGERRIVVLDGADGLGRRDAMRRHVGRKEADDDNNDARVEEEGEGALEGEAARLDVPQPWVQDVRRDTRV